MRERIVDVIASITDDQRKQINEAIANGFPVEIAPSKDGFKIYTVGKKLIAKGVRKWPCLTRRRPLSFHSALLWKLGGFCNIEENAGGAK